MRILIDADGCPVVDLAVSIARELGVDCLILCDTAHTFEKAGARTLVVSKGADSVDFALVNRIHPGDVVITQDYGLAAMCLARKARILSQDGLEYTDANIDALLMARHAAQKMRNAGARLKGPPKRRKLQDAAFANALRRTLGECPGDHAGNHPDGTLSP